jgi:hypothetical protein
VLLALEKVEKKLERLTEDIREQGGKLDAIEKSANRFRLRARRLAAVSWWALGDRIMSAVSTVYRGVQAALMANNQKSSLTVIEVPVSPRSRR